MLNEQNTQKCSKTRMHEKTHHRKRQAHPYAPLMPALQKKSAELGFDVLKITQIKKNWRAGELLEIFLNAGLHGDMDWMEKTAKRRQNPKNLWPEAKTAIVLGMNYGPANNPMIKIKWTEIGNISVYAQNEDYHISIKKKLKALAQWLIAQTEQNEKQTKTEKTTAETHKTDTHKTHVKVFVDTAPLMEKPLAMQAGMGWQGKHTNLVSRHFGSWLFLGAILTNLSLPETPAEQDHCGRCQACLNVCPTQAFIAPYQLDARRCLSYLTIEHKGLIPQNFRKQMGNRIYGCDDCLAVCPWNKFAHKAKEAAFHPRPELQAPLLADLVQLDENAFRKLFARSPIKRIGRNRFIRNVLIAVGNVEKKSEKKYLIKSVCHLLEDPSWLVRGSAVWALKCLSYKHFLEKKPTHQKRETHQEVKQEWHENQVEKNRKI